MDADGSPKTWYYIAFTVWLSKNLRVEDDTIDIINGNQHHFDFAVYLVKFLQILETWMAPFVCHFSAGCKPVPRFCQGL
jgi:hypothetical protein